MYTYEEYYDDYEDEVINESALDMAVDMADRYGIAVEDAYAFACDAMEGSLKDPRKRDLREKGKLRVASDTYDSKKHAYYEGNASDTQWRLDKSNDDVRRNRKYMYGDSPLDIKGGAPARRAVHEIIDNDNRRAAIIKNRANRRFDDIVRADNDTARAIRRGRAYFGK